MNKFFILSMSLVFVLSTAMEQDEKPQGMDQGAHQQAFEKTLNIPMPSGSKELETFMKEYDRKLDNEEPSIEEAKKMLRTPHDAVTLNNDLTYLHLLMSQPKNNCIINSRGTGADFYNSLVDPLNLTTQEFYKRQRDIDIKGKAYAQEHPDEFWAKVKRPYSLHIEEINNLKQSLCLKLSMLLITKAYPSGLEEISKDNQSLKKNYNNLKQLAMLWSCQIAHEKSRERFGECAEFIAEFIPEDIMKQHVDPCITS